MLFCGFLLSCLDPLFGRCIHQMFLVPVYPIFCLVLLSSLVSLSRFKDLYSGRCPRSCYFLQDSALFQLMHRSLDLSEFWFSCYEPLTLYSELFSLSFRTTSCWFCGSCCIYSTLCWLWDSRPSSFRFLWPRQCVSQLFLF